MLTMSKICGIINDSYGDIVDELMSEIDINDN